MRRALNAGEITLLEKHPHSCKLYMVVDKPTVLLSAQVNMPIAAKQTIVNFAHEEPDPTTLYRTWEKLVANEMVKYRDWETDRKSTRLNSSHSAKSRMPSSA